MAGGYSDLKVYMMAYDVAMELFKLSKSFPKGETYALTDQVRRSSRSVCANIGEGYRKRQYPKHFASKMTDADAECSETLIWITFARDCGYLDEEVSSRLINNYLEIGRMLGSMVRNPEKFLPKSE